MSSSTVTTLLAGGFLVVGTVAGSLLTYWLTGRLQAKQRDYEADLRRRELALAEREKFNPVSEADARVIREELGRGGQFLPAKLLQDNANYLRHSWTSAACFPHGTLIMMEDGSFRPVESLQKGDSIRVYKADTHTEAVYAVPDPKVATGKRLVVINNEIAVTPEQQVFSDGFYQPAAKLQLGATLASDDRRGIEVNSVEMATIDEDVYCIPLKEDVGYFIRSAQAEHAIIVREATLGKLSLDIVGSEITEGGSG